MGIKQILTLGAAFAGLAGLLGGCIEKAKWEIFKEECFALKGIVSVEDNYESCYFGAGDYRLKTKDGELGITKYGKAIREYSCWGWNESVAPDFGEKRPESYQVNVPCDDLDLSFQLRRGWETYNYNIRPD